MSQALCSASPINSPNPCHGLHRSRPLVSLGREGGRGLAAYVREAAWAAGPAGLASQSHRREPAQATWPRSVCPSVKWVQERYRALGGKSGL